MSEPLPTFLPAGGTLTPDEQVVLATIPPAPRPVEYRHVIQTSAASMTEERAQRALVGLVMGGAAHAFCHPERPGVTAVCRGPHPHGKGRRRS